MHPSAGSIAAACAGVASAGFTDVVSATHRAAIDCLFGYDIAKGTSSTTYSPERSVSRGQMASFIARLLRQAGVALPSGETARFSDVPAGAVHTTAVNQLAELGVVKGVNASSYAPDMTVTRAQMASFLVRAYGSPRRWSC